MNFPSEGVHPQVAQTPHKRSIVVKEQIEEAMAQDSHAVKINEIGQTQQMLESALAHRLNSSASLGIPDVSINNDDDQPFETPRTARVATETDQLDQDKIVSRKSALEQISDAGERLPTIEAVEYLAKTENLEPKDKQ